MRLISACVLEDWRKTDQIEHFANLRLQSEDLWWFISALIDQNFDIKSLCEFYFGQCFQ